MTYNESIASASTVLVEFYASWCPHCQRMMPIVEKVKDSFDGRVPLFQYDIDDNKELAEKMKVESIPTFIVYRDGKEAWRHTGEMTEEALRDAVERYTHEMA